MMSAETEICFRCRNNYYILMKDFAITLRTIKEVNWLHFDFMLMQKTGSIYNLKKTSMVGATQNLSIVHLYEVSR